MSDALHASPRSTSYLWIAALSAFGILLSLFLLWEQLARPAFQPCNINATVNCDAVISGSVAFTFGIRTPLYGLIGYIVLFVAVVLKQKKTLLWVATGGLAFCLYLAFIELVQLRIVCPVCIMCQLTMITIWILAFRLTRKKE